jgi:hypothetical protein
MIPDPSLGIPVGFDSQGFRNAIGFAMQMGTPPDPARRPKFIKRSNLRTFWKDGVELPAPPRMGRNNEPLDPDVEVRITEPEAITVDCAIEIDAADADELPVGSFRPTKVICTLLDDAYARVEGCKELVYNGDRYLYGYEPEANGLFDVGVHTIVFYALDES